MGWAEMERRERSLCGGVLSHASWCSSHGFVVHGLRHYEVRLRRGWGTSYEVACWLLSAAVVGLQPYEVRLRLSWSTLSEASRWLRSMASTVVDGPRKSGARLCWSRRPPYVFARRALGMAMVALLMFGLAYLVSAA
jgi:hypothetical protein